MRDLESGTLIDGRYRVASRLGSGGMADVYCATDEQLGRKVAVKLLHPRFAEDAEFVERFRREASSAAGLSHPNIVNVYDRGEFDGTYYIAMEYLDGRSMKKLVTEEGALDPVRAIDLVTQILRAARSAHQRGVIHRDLKPQNAIVDAEGVVKVTDFGIARAGASDMTETGSIMGTAQYLSPEQAQGQAVSAASDLYSIGIILYELLTGRIPFDGPSAVTIALKQVTEPPPAPSLINPAVPVELDAVVLRALAKDPAERFADAAEFLAALEQARQALLAPAGSSTAQFGAVPAPAVYEPAPGEPPYAPLAPLDQRGRAWPWVLATLVVLGLGLGAFLVFGSSSKSVPDVVAKSAPAASAILTGAGFHVAERPQPSSTVPRGDVIATFPAAHASASKGSTVTLIVSSGPGVVTVPNVVSLDRRAAAEGLRRAGFQVIETLSPSDTVPRDHVVSTDPLPLTEVQAGSTVTLTISTGRSRVTVPSVLGQTYEQASASLQAAGFQVARVDQVSGNQKPDTVIKQDPAAGTVHTKGSTVTLTVTKTANQVVVPAVTGLAEPDARSTLIAAGLTVGKTKTVTVTDPTQNGVVISQNPAAGRSVKRGAHVTLTVGKAPPTTTTTTPTTPTTTTTTPTTPTPGTGAPGGPAAAVPKASG
jgi:eukaryotic-like serine/threonine-protein kinase